MFETVRRLNEMSLVPLEFGLRRPTLDDVFLTLTGAPAEDGAGPEPARTEKARTEKTRPEKTRGRK